MASITFFQSLIAGIEKITLDEGDGLGNAPVLDAALCWGINKIRITFSKKMLARLPEGLVGDVSSYSVYETANPANILLVLRVILIHENPTKCDLYCFGMQQGVDYTVEVIGDVLDEFGVPIDHDADTQAFLGQGHQIPAPSADLTLFAGLEAGIQTFEETNWRPDLIPPYVVDMDPAPGSSGIATDYIPSFNLKDDETGIKAISTIIWVGGIKIFENGASLGSFSVAVTPISNGYHYVLNHSSPLPNGLLPIRVYGEDLAYVANTVDYTWSFSVAAFSITDISPLLVCEGGGDSLTMAGIWTPDRDMVIHFGPLGTEDDPTCYFGYGIGPAIKSPANGIVTCYLPHAPVGNNKITIRIGLDVQTLSTLIKTVERPRKGKLFSIRSCFPPWAGVGPRTEGNEPYWEKR